jgi:serine/threonine protein kinase
MIKLTDFDLSFKLGDEKMRGRGTVHYRAPEIKDKKVKFPMLADIYSAGIILFLLKNGYLPCFETEKIYGYDLYKLLLEDIEGFWQAHVALDGADTFDNDFKILFRGMVAKNPEERMSIAEIRTSNWYNGPIYTQEELGKVLGKVAHKDMKLSKREW